MVWAKKAPPPPPVGNRVNPKHLFVQLAGPISRTSIQYMDFVEIFNVSLDLSTTEFVHFSNLEPPLCLVVILS